jgi:hypothetical protein
VLTILLDSPRHVRDELRDLHAVHFGFDIDRATAEDRGVRAQMVAHGRRNELVAGLRASIQAIQNETKAIEGGTAGVWLPRWTPWTLDATQEAAGGEALYIKAETTRDAIEQMGLEYTAPPSVTIQRIDVPEPLAFNGAVAPLGDGRYFCAYRAAQFRLSCITLDKDFQPIPGTHEEMAITHNVDPRLIQTTRGLLLSTSFHNGRDQMELRRVSFDVDGRHHLQDVDKYTRVDGVTLQPHEKNWVPWEHAGELLLTYSASPHQILRIRPDGSAALAYTSTWNVPSNVNEYSRGNPFALRLNTPPVLLSTGHYLSTCHTRHHPHGYFNFFYTFDAVPPFRVTGFSRLPVLTPRHASGQNLRDAVAVLIFPQSMLVDEAAGQVTLAGGDNDHSVVVVRLSLSEVLAGMMPVG